MTLSVRAAAPSDYEAYAQLLPELGVDDPLPSMERWMREFLPTTLVAEFEGEVVGYLYHQCFARVGYVRNVVTKPSHRRAGVGRALMEAARAEFARRGATEWCLNVKPDNVAARGLYDALGFRLAYESKVWRLPWAALDAWVGPGRAASGSVEVRPLAEHEDGAFESSQGLLLGLLADSRRQPDRLILGLLREGRAAGVLVFNPHYPGCFPFRLSEPDLLRDFLGALRPHARSDQSWLQLVVEGQPAVSDALQAHQAELRLEILNLRGTL